MELNFQNFINQTKNNQYNSTEWNLPAISNNNLQGVQQNVASGQVQINTGAVKDEFVKHKKKRNFVEKLTDKIKNITHIGFGSKKAGKIIENASEEEAKKAFEKYKATEETAAQTVGDVASATAGVGVFYGILKGSKYLDSMIKTDAIPEQLRNVSEIAEKLKDTKFAKLAAPAEKAINGFKKLISSKAGTIAVGAGAAMLLGGILKSKLLKPNVKEHKLDKEQKKTLSRAEKKEAKKELRKAKRKENRRNFLTGALNGVAAPLLSLAGVVGAPIYAAGSFLLRHKTAQNENGTIIDDLKNNAVITALGTAAVAIPMIKSGKGYKVFAKNMDKVVENLKGKKLQAPDFDTTKTTYAELEEILLGDKKVKTILNDCGMEDAEKIKALTDENIFAVKFKQIQNSYDPLTIALRESCPPSRTLEEAQKAIDGLSKAGEYKVDKLLGVGTIAETYLAHDASGKEVCVKILKNGISKEKILADKAKFAQLITQGKATEALSENQKYLLRNLDNLSDGILKEVDFKNEMEAAKKLKQFTRKANVVVPIKANDGIYVMEKARGISVETLSKYCSLASEKEYAQIMLEKAKAGTTSKTVEECTKQLESIEKRVAKLRERAPEFKDFDLSDKEVKKFLTEYIDVYTEQFEKIEKSGKTLHADIHPGNVFVDVEALKSGKGKVLTLIDTGNTVNLSAAQSKRALELTNYIQRGNSKDITRYVLEGAKLPEGMTQEQAIELVEGEFNKLFFDNATRLEMTTNDSILSTANGIMKKHNIIPNDDQLNLNKAKQSAKNSFNSLRESFLTKKHGAQMEAAEDAMYEAAGNGLEGLKSKEGKAAAMGIIKNTAKYGKDSLIISLRQSLASKVQQIKNLFQNSPKTALKELKNPNNNKKTSEKYLTYKLKQLITKFNPEKVENNIFS